MSKINASGIKLIVLLSQGVSGKTGVAGDRGIVLRL